MRAHDRHFPADLCFVITLLMAVFSAPALLYSAAWATPWRLMIEAMCYGPLALMRPQEQGLSAFVSLSALPMLQWGGAALTARLAADLEARWPRLAWSASLVWLGATSLGLAACGALTSPLALLITGTTLALGALALRLGARRDAALWRRPTPALITMIIATHSPLSALALWAQVAN